ncbi:MAG: hypothetical protein JWO60_1187, partial [Frankiales bacterium]|nr:hypothetical protein [Frankiales bacterium]
MTPLPAPGWYADAGRPPLLRWWDGARWTAHTLPTPPPPAPTRVLDRRSAWVFGVTGLLSLLFLLTETGLSGFLLASALALLLLPLTAGAVLLIDRVHPEPHAVLAWTFVAGATAVLLWAVVVNSTAEAVLAEVVGAGTAERVSGSVVAPLVEESGKAAVLLLLLHRFRHRMSGPLDGVVYAAAVGLGFSTVEDVLYYGVSLDDGSLVETVVVRGVLSPFAHPLFTAFTGIGLGLLVSRRTRLGRVAPALGFVVAVALHSFWNSVTDTDGLLLLLLPTVMVPVFVGLLVLCVRESRRERRLIPVHLADEVGAGVL